MIPVAVRHPATPPLEAQAPRKLEAVLVPAVDQAITVAVAAAESTLGTVADGRSRARAPSPHREGPVAVVAVVAVAAVVVAAAVVEVKKSA